MKLDDLMCLATILFFIYCVIDNIYSSSIYKKTESVKSLYLDNLISKFKEKFRIFIPKKNRETLTILDNDKLNQDTKKILYKIFRNLGQFEIKNIILKAKNYNKIKFLKVEFSLVTYEIIKKIYLEIIYLNPKEYHIIKLRNLEEKKKLKASPKFRKSKFYNKWII